MHFFASNIFVICFNTQPPEGGCKPVVANQNAYDGFNTQPPEGGCQDYGLSAQLVISFNTQPPEGGCSLNRCFTVRMIVSTHSRPKAAAG